MDLPPRDKAPARPSDCERSVGGGPGLQLVLRIFCFPRKMVRRRAALGAATALAALSLLVSSCGGKGSPAVASVTSSSTTAVSSTHTRLVGYTDCMRSNGVRGFPEPEGKLLPELDPQRLGVSQSQLEAALSACSHLLPGATRGNATIPPAARVDYLRGSACMRSHGFRNFPDPVFLGNGSGVRYAIPSSIDRSSSRFERAVATCEKLIPSGLPYGASNDRN